VNIIHRPGLIAALLSAIVGLYSMPLHAVQVDHLYEASVPVADQNPSSRGAALSEILKKVVTKVSGQSVLPSSLISQAGSIEHMVEQFGYDSRQENGVRQLQLWAKLSPDSVKRLIRDAQLPVWPEERPATLVWIGIEDTAGREVLAEGSANEAMSLIKQVAGERGLPIVLPIMDLQESSVINPDVLATMQAEAISLASEKYGTDYVLTGYLQRTDAGLWRGRWKLAGESERVVTTAPGPLDDIIHAGIDPLATRIATQFASYSYVDGEQYIDLAIDDINGAEDYARSLNYLQSLSVVSNVDVIGVEKQRVNFRLHTRADFASVLQVIGLGRVLYARDNIIDQLVFGLNP
jgi:hypothetical protein